MGPISFGIQKIKISFCLHQLSTTVLFYMFNSFIFALIYPKNLKGYSDLRSGETGNNTTIRKRHHVVQGVGSGTEFWGLVP